MPEAEFRSLVQSSFGIGAVLEEFGLENVGRNHWTARARIEELKIDVGHFDPRKRRYPSPRKTLSELLIENGTSSVTRLKQRLIKTGTITMECAACGLGPSWNAMPLVLRLDHKNGKRRDHRIENLRLLCPNCDSQQPTFAGRNNRRDQSPAT